MIWLKESTKDNRGVKVKGKEPQNFNDKYGSILTIEGCDLASPPVVLAQTLDDIGTQMQYVAAVLFRGYTPEFPNLFSTWTIYIPMNFIKSD